MKDAIAGNDTDCFLRMRYVYLHASLLSLEFARDYRYFLSALPSGTPSPGGKWRCCVEVKVLNFPNQSAVCGQDNQANGYSAAQLPSDTELIVLLDIRANELASGLIRMAREPSSEWFYLV